MLKKKYAVSFKKDKCVFQRKKKFTFYWHEETELYLMELFRKRTSIIQRSTRTRNRLLQVRAASSYAATDGSYPESDDRNGSSPEEDITPSQVMHARFGHFSDSYLRAAGLHCRMKGKFCNGCAIGKSAARAQSKNINDDSTGLFRPSRRLQQIHVDTFGPLPDSHRGNKFYVVGKDEYTGFVFGFPTRRSLTSHVS